MRSWEKSKNIIVFYQSFPTIEYGILSFMMTVTSSDYEIFSTFVNNYNNPEFKDEPRQIIDDVMDLLDLIGPQEINIQISSTLIDKDDDRRLDIYGEFLIPSISLIMENWKINSMTEVGVNLLSLNGLFKREQGILVNDAINTILYV